MADIKQILSTAIQTLLAPLARVLIRYGVSHKEFVEMAKHAYVQAAFNYFSIPGRKNTVSRVAVMTGLSRKEVLRLKEAGSPHDTGQINRAARVIGGWLQDVEFLDRAGKPAQLPITGDGGSFKTLVKRYSGDITSGAILDELIRVGAVEMTDKQHVRLVTEGYIPLRSPEDKIRIMGTSVADMVDTIHYNLGDPTLPRFQREVIYTELPEAVVRDFKMLSYEKSLQLLLELNQWLAQKKRGLSDEEKVPQSRVGLGIYYFEHEPNARDDEKS